MYMNKQIQVQRIRQRLIQIQRIKQLQRIPYPLKQHYNPIIPLNIYQTWHTKKLPPKMFESINLIKNLNPRFNYQLFDDNDCYQFIKDNFDQTVLNAYNSLIPGAYKADLWRYCILYINGGIYLDIKYGPINNFKFIHMTEKEHWVLDVGKTGIYNALLVCLPKNLILLKAIKAIVENVKNKFYGNSVLSPTGPLLLSNFFTTTEKQQFDMKHIYINNYENRFIIFNNYFILKSYPNYLKESKQFQKVNHYSTLWNQRKIYK